MNPTPTQTLPNRKTIRLQHYDYSQNGAYFVTLRVRENGSTLSKISEDPATGECRCITTPIGQVIETALRELEARYPTVKIPNYVIMPDHVHFIVVIKNDMAGEAPPVGRIVGSFKSVTTRQINAINDCHGRRIWQRNYYEHIIRNEQEHLIIIEYIENNPKKRLLQDKNVWTGR